MGSAKVFAVPARFFQQAQYRPLRRRFRRGAQHLAGNDPAVRQVFGLPHQRGGHSLHRLAFPAENFPHAADIFRVPGIDLPQHRGHGAAQRVPCRRAGV